MTFKKKLALLGGALTLGLGAVLATSTWAAEQFDLSPEQHGRPRASADAAAIKAVPPGFAFAEKDTLTIGIVPALPPISA